MRTKFKCSGCEDHDDKPCIIEVPDGMNPPKVCPYLHFLTNTEIFKLVANEFKDDNCKWEKVEEFPRRDCRDCKWDDDQEICAGCLRYAGRSDKFEKSNVERA